MLLAKRINHHGLLMIVLALVLAACATPGAAPLESETPAMTAQPPVPGEPAVTEAPSVSGSPTPEEAVNDLRPIEVQDVRVEIGVGSPIPVEVLAGVVEELR